MSTLYGPPLPKPKAYPYMLESLEASANKKLTLEYSEELKQYRNLLELQLKVNPQMIDLQPEIQWYMRPFLVDFLIELHTLFRLQPSTLFLCMNIIDRYCARRVVFKRHYQLVGCTALWIAGKYEDKKLRVPTLKELSIMCRQAYDEEMFVQMEMHILATIEWLLGHPLLEEILQIVISETALASNSTPIKYNNHPSVAGSTVAQKVSAVSCVARFLCELSLYDRYFMTVPSSLIAYSATLMACNMLNVQTSPSFAKDIMTSLATKSRSDECMRAGQDGENQAPALEINQYIQGVDDEILNTVRKISIALMLRTATVSDVLHRKYAKLGVIPVVLNFRNKHPVISDAIFKRGDCVTSETCSMLPLDLTCAADVLLKLSSDEIKPLLVEASLPATPSLATSLALLFSTHANSSMCGSPSLSMDSASLTACSPMAKMNWSLPISSSHYV